MVRYLLLLVLLLSACGGGSNPPGPARPAADTTPPVITLTGDNPQTILTGNAYVELGATATDNQDGDVSGLIVIDASAVNTNAAGTYSVTYNVRDAANNAAATVTRTITVEDPPPPAAPSVTVNVDIKQLVFSWPAVPNATHYKLLENSDGHSGFSQVGDDLSAATLSAVRHVAVHFHDFVNALYIVQACSDWGCTNSAEVHAMNSMLDAIGYFKASNTGEDDRFGTRIALSGDGSVMAVAAIREASAATGLNGIQDDDSAPSAGAVYVFRFDGAHWSQQAYVKASNAEAGDRFGLGVALSHDGSILAVGAPNEQSNATGISGDQSDNSAVDAGAVYIFQYNGGFWRQQAYIKGSNTQADDGFGWSVALSGDGTALAVGAISEASNATGVNGDQGNNSADESGAAYIFRFDGADWSQQAYIKASNTGGWDVFPQDPDGTRGDGFGRDIALSDDGNTLVVGAAGEDSGSTGVNGSQGNSSSTYRSGAAYLFRFDGTDWFQQAYIKASNTGYEDGFGSSVTLSSDGNTLAVGASSEDSSAVGIGGDESDNSASNAGAVYIFRFDGNAWLQQAYVKATNTRPGSRFGTVSLSADGTTIAVGSRGEDGGSVGINGDQSDSSVNEAGAAYLLRYDAATWSHTTYVKAPNPGEDDKFSVVALSADAGILAVGASGEDSKVTGIDANQEDNSAAHSGAVYIY